jgi:hypothetical protein
MLARKLTDGFPVEHEPILCYSSRMIGHRHCKLNRGKLNRRAAWLAVFALLLQALLPAVHHPGGMALAGTLALGDAHLCLAPGSAPVSPGDTDKSPHHAPACAICQAVHAIGGFAPPAAPVLAGQTAIATSFAPSRSAAPVSRQIFRAQQPRAPPSFA